MDRVLKEEDLARVPFLDDDPPRGFIANWAKISGKNISRPAPPPLERFFAFSREPHRNRGIYLSWRKPDTEILSLRGPSLLGVVVSLT